MFNRVVFFEDHLYVVNPLTGCYLKLLGVDHSVTPGEKSLSSRLQVLTPPLQKKMKRQTAGSSSCCRPRANDDYDTESVAAIPLADDLALGVV